MKCTSCGANIEPSEKWVRFPCPACLKKEIVRCERCKKLINNYKCECGFIGP
jgi:predicted RNA-binding Zn-ribbon protein involved in translation (DUF1610 family)